MSFPAQYFEWIDLPVIFILLGLEVLLSADNATALALLVRPLEKPMRKKALFVGLFTGIFLRALAILFAAYLIQFFWIQIIGGLYLIYIALKHIFNWGKKKKIKKEISFWRTVIKVELTDLMFAVDSILAAFALVTLYYPFNMVPHKIWVIYLGGVLGIIAMRAAASFVNRFLDHYPNFERIIFLFIGWMGLKLIIESFDPLIASNFVKKTIDSFFWLGGILIIIIGFLSSRWDKRV